MRKSNLKFNMCDWYWYCVVSLASKLSGTALGLAEDSKVESFLYSKSGNIIASNLKVNNQELEFDVSTLMLSSEQQTC